MLQLNDNILFSLFATHKLQWLINYNSYNDYKWLQMITKL